VADGTTDAAKRLRNTLDCDTGLGILRHADAGYDSAIAARRRFALGLGSTGE
jgi:urocanate hydratase